MRILIHEPDARVRGLMSGILRDAGAQVDVSYADAMIERAIAKMPTDEPWVLLGDRTQRDWLERAHQDRAVFVDSYEREKLRQGGSTAKDHAYQALDRMRRECSRLGRRDAPIDLICIGSSTGGFPVVQEMLKGLELDRCIVVLAQHVSAEMSDELCGLLSSRSRSRVVLVDSRTTLRPGQIAMLRGGQDYIIRQAGVHLVVHPKNVPEAHYHPAIDPLLESVAKLTVASLAIILSGIGEDGAVGAGAVAAAGGRVLLQDPKDAVAPGMPGATLRLVPKARAVAKEDLPFVFREIAC